jgi:hypothetical protein
MDMINRFYGNQPTIIGRGTIGTARLNVYELVQAIDWGAVFNIGYALDVISSSANDAAAGTGARTLTIYGLANDGTPQNETVTLNGQTAVTTTKAFWRVFGALVATAGTGRANAGDIYIYKTGTGGTITSGVPGTLTSAAIKIPLTENFGSSGMWTAPLGTAYTLDQIVPSCRAQAGRLEVVHAGSRNAVTLLPYTALSYDIGICGPTWLDYHEGNDYVLTLNQLEDIYFRATMAAASGIISFVAKLQIVSPRTAGIA